MVIRHKSSGKIISKDAEYLNFHKKIFGLLAYKNNKTVVFKTHFGIHTFRLKKSIDVLVLNQKFQITNLKTVKPNQVFLWNPKNFWVVESLYGSIKKFKLKKGDVLVLN